MATICGDPEAQNAATLFPKFSQLPLELRLQIWLMTLPGPRRIGPRHRTHIDTQIEIKDFQTPDPIALQINRESRELALKYYTPRNPTHLASWSKKDNCSYNTHIDFTNDLTVLIDATRHFSLTRYPFVLNPPKDYTTTSFSNRFFSREEMNKITNLTLISEDFSFVLFHVKEWLQDWLPIFKSLKKCEFRVWVPEAERGLMRYWYGTQRLVGDILREVNAVVRRVLEGVRVEREVGGVERVVPVFEVGVFSGELSSEMGWDV